MKLPTYEQMAFVSHPTVSPQQAAAPGKAMARFSEVASNVVGDIASDMYETEAVTEYNRGIAEISKRAKGLSEFYLATPEMTKDQAGDLWQDQWAEARTTTVTNALGQEEEQTIETIPTWRISADHFEREMGNAYTEIDGNLRTPKAKASFSEKYNLELQPKWQGAADARHASMVRKMEKAQWEESGVTLVNQPDEQLVHEWLETGIAAGHVAPEDAPSFRREKFEEFALNGYQRDLTDPNMTTAAREAIGADIKADPSLTAEAEAAATTEWLKAVYSDHDDDISAAIVDRDAGALRAIMREYEDDYDGPLGDTERLVLHSKAARALKSWQAEGQARADAAKVLAQTNIDGALKALNNGDAISPESVAMLPSEISAYIKAVGDKPSAAETKKLIEYRNELATLDIKNDLMHMNVQDANAKAAGDADARMGTFNGDAQGRSILAANSAYTKAKLEDPQAYQDRIRPDIDLAGYDSGDIHGSAVKNLEATATAAMEYGVPHVGFSQAFVDGFQREYANADAITQGGMVARIRDAADYNPAVLENFWGKMALKGDNSWVVPSIEGSTIRDIDAAKRGREIVRTPEGRSVLDGLNLDKDERKTLLKGFTDDIYQYYPNQSGERAGAATELTIGYVLDGMSVSDAKKAARELVLGGEPVKNSGSSITIIPPDDITSQRRFREEQRRIKTSFYERHGYQDDDDVRELITRGDMVWKNSERGRNVYELYDTREGYYPVTSVSEDGTKSIVRFDYSDVTAMDRDTSKEFGAESAAVRMGFAPPPEEVEAIKFKEDDPWERIMKPYGDR